MIPRNPAALVDPPKVRREEIVPLDPSEARLFFDASGGEQFGALFMLSLTTGLRMGEALGLKWADIEIEAAPLRVNRQLQRMRRDSENDAPGTLAFSEPKNASRRSVDLSQRACTTPQKPPQAPGGRTAQAGAAWRNHGLVFATTVGTPLDAQNIVNRHFEPLLRRAKMPDIRQHDLRHTYATLLLAKGIHPKYVQTALGHASIQLTLDTYSHWMPSMGRDTAAAIDDALEDERAASPSGGSGPG